MISITGISRTILAALVLFTSVVNARAAEPDTALVERVKEAVIKELRESGALAVFAFLLAVWLPNLELLRDIFFESGVPLVAKLSIALALLPLNGAEFGLLSVALLFASLLLISRNIAEPAACPLARAPNA